MPVKRFYLANTLSAAIWAPTHILPGVLLGASFSHLGVAAIPVASLFMVLVLVVWIMVKLVRYLTLYVEPIITAVVARLHAWAKNKELGSARVLAQLLDPSRAESRSILTLGAVLVGSAWMFLDVFEDVLGKDPLVRLDTAIYQILQALRTDPGDAVMIAITEIGDATVVVSVAVAVLIWLLIQRAWRSSAWQGLPERRTDLSGEIEEPFTIQWAGSIKSIRTTLEANGWELAPSWNLTGISHWLGNQTTPRERPVVPALRVGVRIKSHFWVFMRSSSKA